MLLSYKFTELVHKKFATSAWKAFAGNVRSMFVDRVHDGQYSFLAYRPHPDSRDVGVFVKIEPSGRLTAGFYEWAHRHISDALFRPVHTIEFSNYESAHKWYRSGYGDVTPRLLDTIPISMFQVMAAA